MKFEGQQIIPAPLPLVWQSLNDPAILKIAIPGCESLERQQDQSLNATVRLAIGPVRARFNGNVVVEPLEPPYRTRLQGKAQGGPAGQATGNAEVCLEPLEDNSTRLTFVAELQVQGKLAQIGSRLLDSTFKRLSTQFFNDFAQALEPPSSRETTPTPAPPARAQQKRRLLTLAVALALAAAVLGAGIALMG